MIEGSNLLETLRLPQDIKKLDAQSLEELCSEIRQVLINTVSKNGGHLSSNLGVVELTVALHKAFNFANDRLVFDVGHQCYTHKILTGRLEKFGTLRQQGGISGFPRPSESIYDAFSAGHSSTSVSAAFGMSQAKSLKKDNGYVVAVIGDGALTGGLAYEALNNAGRSKDKLIVILNDNKMSISRNVGAMSRHLAVLRIRPEYHTFKSKTERLILHIPLVGKPLRNGIFKLKRAMKGLLFKSSLFEDMGFMYLGPVDGHDLKKLGDVLEIAKNARKPVLLHVNTIKGKGYSFAEKGPNVFHGVSAFDVETGERLSSGESFSSAFGAALCGFAENDKRICAITAAMCESTGLEPFQKQFRSRFYDVGIAEQHAVTFAAGLSISGMIPVFAVYSTFLQRAYDQILHDAALQNLKVILAIDRAGVVGEDGETHQGVFDVAFLSSIPNITIYSPATFNELRHDMKLAIYNDKGVVAIRYPRGGETENAGELDLSEKLFDVFFDENAGLTLVTYGRETGEVYKAAQRLTAEGVSLKLVKLNCIRPVPEGVLDIVLCSKKVYFFEEGMKNGGIAQQMTTRLYEKGYTGTVSITAVDDRFIPHATVEETLKMLELDAESIYNKIKEG